MNIRNAAIDDAEILFDWANDSDVRSNAVSNDKIDWINHINWLYKKLSSEYSNIFIGEINNKPIGQIRFDFENNKYLIDYSITKFARGKGYGIEIVKKGIENMKISIGTPITFEAWVKPENTASRKVFQKLGFSLRQSIVYNETKLIIFEFNYDTYI